MFYMVQTVFFQKEFFKKKKNKNFKTEISKSKIEKIKNLVFLRACVCVKDKNLGIFPDA